MIGSFRLPTHSRLPFIAMGNRVNCSLFFVFECKVFFSVT